MRRKGFVIDTVDLLNPRQQEKRPIDYSTPPRTLKCKCGATETAPMTRNQVKCNACCHKERWGKKR